MKKTDQFELPFEGRSSDQCLGSSCKSVNARGYTAPVVCLTEKRLHRHVGVVYGRLVERGFTTLPRQKG